MLVSPASTLDSGLPCIRLRRLSGRAEEGADFALTQVSDQYPVARTNRDAWRSAAMGRVHLSGGASGPAGQAIIHRLYVQQPV
jgi:hypothetical protein